jgi:hypothetical protein
VFGQRERHAAISAASASSVGGCLDALGAARPSSRRKEDERREDDEKAKTSL